jgi:hypothetical protein
VVCASEIHASTRCKPCKPKYNSCVSLLVTGNGARFAHDSVGKHEVWGQGVGDRAHRPFCGQEGLQVR